MNLSKHSNYGTYDVSHLFRNGFRVGFLCSRFEQQLTQLEEAEIEVEIGADGITATGLERDKLTKFLLIFGGDWKKEVEDYYPDKMKYTQDLAEIPGLGVFSIRASQVPPPPSCVIVEEEVEVPASKKLVKRIKCPEPLAGETAPEQEPQEVVLSGVMVEVKSDEDVQPEE